jgi:histidine triad (HIT) family protein
MRMGVLLFAAGVLVGELGPIEWGAWRVIATRLPAMKAESLAQPSPFELLPRTRWIAESPRAYALENDVEPIAPVHLLVVPKERHPSMLDAPPDLLGEMLALARTVAAERGIAGTGFRIIINTNPEGGQTAYHLHMHVLGGTQLTWPLLPLIRGRFVATAVR